MGYPVCIFFIYMYIFFLHFHQVLNVLGYMEQLSESNLRPFLKQVVTASNEKFKQEKLKKSGSKVAFVLKSVLEYFLSVLTDYSLFRELFCVLFRENTAIVFSLILRVSSLSILTMAMKMAVHCCQTSLTL